MRLPHRSGGARPRVGAVVAASLVGVVGCHDGPRSHPGSGVDAPAALAKAADASKDAGPASRCTLAPGDATAAKFGAGAELGESVPYKGGYALGALRAGDAGRLASVVIAGISPSTTIDLASSWGDAPPPQPIVRGDDLYAVGYVRRGAEKPKSARYLSLHHALTKDAQVDFPPESDTSAAYDVIAAPTAAPIGALVAWDDLAGAGPTARGVIQLASLAPDVHAVHATHPFSPLVEEKAVPADASDPRLAHRKDGYWLVWLARRPERGPSALPVPAGEIEVPSQEATYGWLEAAMLDAEGNLVGKPKRLTGLTGHVGDFALDAETTDGSLLIVAEDDGTAGGGAGGRLEQVVWKGEGNAEVTHIVQDGAAEDSPPNVIGDAEGGPWLSFRDVHGDVGLTPLFPTLGHAGMRPSPSSEPVLGKSRVLSVKGGRFVVASEVEGGWELRSVVCVR